MSDQARNKRIRGFGASFAVYVRDNPETLSSTIKLQAVAADILGVDQTLLLPIKELIAAPAFRRLASLAGSGTGSVQRDSALQALAGTFSAGVIADLEAFLGGFLDLPARPHEARLIQSPTSPRVAPAAVPSATAKIQKPINTGAGSNRWLPAGFALLGAALAILAAGGWYLYDKSMRPRPVATVPAVDPAAKAFTENGRSIELGDAKQSGEIVSGPIEVNAELLNEKTSSGLATKTPVVSVSVNGQEVGRLVGAQAPYASSVVQLADLDPSNKYPEVILSSFTGGAHCCTEIKALTSDASGNNWSEVKLGSYDGGPAPAEDPLDDGRFYITVADDRFLYKFTNYACSASPTRLLRLDGKSLKDVTLDQAFIAYHSKAARSFEDSLPPAGDERYSSDCINGFLAGYVAAKALVGELQSGWQTMLRSYFRGSDWGLKECLSGYDGKGDCQGPETVYSSFPEALKALLLRSGYIKVGSSASLTI